MSKLRIKISEATTIPDKTLHTILANLKCLGKPGKAMRNYPVKRRFEIFAEMEKRGWLEPDSMNLTDKGNEEAKKWVHLCQESKSSMTIKVHGIDEKKYNAKLDTMMDEFKRVLGSDYKFKVYNEPHSFGQQLVIGVPGVGEFFCFYELAYTNGKFNVHTWEADASFDKNCDMSVFHELEAIFKKYCEG